MYSLSVLFLQGEENCPLCVCSWITKHIKKNCPSSHPISTLPATGTNLSASSIQPLFSDSKTKLLKIEFQDHDEVVLSTEDVSFQSLQPQEWGFFLYWSGTSSGARAVGSGAECLLWAAQSSWLVSCSFQCQIEFHINLKTFGEWTSAKGSSNVSSLSQYACFTRSRLHLLS